MFIFADMKENQTYDQKSLRAVSGSKADFDEIAKDCVAFANREGGRLAIGIEDGEDLPPQEQRIPDSLKEIIVKRLNERTINVALVSRVIKADNGGDRLPDIPFTDLQKCVRKMATEWALVYEGGRKYRDSRILLKKI